MVAARCSSDYSGRSSPLLIARAACHIPRGAEHTLWSHQPPQYITTANGVGHHPVTNPGTVTTSRKRAHTNRYTDARIAQALNMCVLSWTERSWVRWLVQKSAQISTGILQE